MHIGTPFQLVLHVYDFVKDNKNSALQLQETTSTKNLLKSYNYLHN